MEQTSVQYLSFKLGSDQYAVDILKVKEIRGWEAIRPIPDMPDHVLGVLGFRGNVVPIVDLRVRFKVTPVVYEPTTVIIIFAYQVLADERLLGVVVDAVSDVLDVEPVMRCKAPEMGSYIDTRFMEAMVNTAEGVTILLDIEKLLDPDELMRLELMAGSDV